MTCEYEVGGGSVTRTARPAGHPHALQRPVLSSKAAGQRGSRTCPPPYSLTTAVQEHGVLTLSDLRIHPHGVLQVKGNFKKCHYPTV